MNLHLNKDYFNELIVATSNEFGIPSNLPHLISQVRLERSKLDVCPSAKEDVNVYLLINEIIEKQAYKNDYEIVTMNLLFTKVTYDQAIKSLTLLNYQKLWE